MVWNRWLTLITIFALLLLGVGIGLAVGLNAGRQDGAVVSERPAAADLEPTRTAPPAAVAETPAENSAPAALPIPPTLEVPPTPTSPPPPTATPAPPTSTPDPTATAEPSLTPTPTSTSTLTPTPTPSVTPTREGPVAEAREDAGFFAGPGVEYGRANYFAPTGEIMVLLGRSDDGQWVHAVSSANSFEGWVSARFLTLLSGSIDELDLSTFRGRRVAAFEPTRPAGSGSGSAPASGAAYFAYLDGSGRGNGDGTWSGELLVQVPTGYTYTFDLGAAYEGDARQIKEDEGGRNEYVLPLTVRCGGAFVGDLRVFQNGSQMPVFNLYTRQAVAVYIDIDCD